MSSRPSWKKDHQTKQKLNEKEAKWVSSLSSLLCLQDEEEGKSEGVGLRHGGKPGHWTRGQTDRVGLPEPAVAHWQPKEGLVVVSWTSLVGCVSLLLSGNHHGHF